MPRYVLVVAVDPVSMYYGKLEGAVIKAEAIDRVPHAPGCFSVKGRAINDAHGISRTGTGPRVKEGELIFCGGCYLWRLSKKDFE